MRIEAALTTGDRFIQKDEPCSLHPQGPLGRAHASRNTSMLLEIVVKIILWHVEISKKHPLYPLHSNIWQWNIEFYILDDLSCFTCSKNWTISHQIAIDFATGISPTCPPRHPVDSEPHLRQFTGQVLTLAWKLRNPGRNLPDFIAASPLIEFSCIFQKCSMNPLLIDCVWLCP